MIDRCDALLGSLAPGLAGGAAAQQPGRRLVPASGLLRDPDETIVERSPDPQIRDRAMTAIARPRLVVFRPERPNGDASPIAPGGAYARVVLDKEGYELGPWLAARGVTAFILFYRLPGEGWARRSVRLIRSRTSVCGVVPERVAVMGFSAAGHVCGSLATRYDASVYTPIDAVGHLNARPLFAAHAGSRDLLPGPTASPAAEHSYTTAAAVTARTPPCFLVHAEDDKTVPVDNSTTFHEACRRAGVPVEMHLFAAGGHGFGVRGTTGKPAAAWPDLFLARARTQGWHPRSRSGA